MKKIVNMTPHPIRVLGENGELIREFPSEGQIRLSQSTERIGTVDGIPLSRTVYGTADLPPVLILV